MWICVIFMCIMQIISQMNTLFPSGMKVKVKVVQLCPALCDPMDYIVHGILQFRILEWVAFSFSRGSSQPRDQTQISHIAGGFLTNWAMKEALCEPLSTWTVACQAPLPMEFSRQEYWNESSPGDFPNPGIKPRYPALQADPLLSKPPGKPTPKRPSPSIFHQGHSWLWPALGWVQWSGLRPSGLWPGDGLSPLPAWYF